MSTFPVLRNPPGGCCPRPAGTKSMTGFCRTLQRPVVNTAAEDVLQDEAGFAVNDEVTDGFIYDTLKQGGVFNNE